MSPVFHLCVSFPPHPVLHSHPFVSRSSASCSVYPFFHIQTSAHAPFLSLSSSSCSYFSPFSFLCSLLFFRPSSAPPVYPFLHIPSSARAPSPDYLPPPPPPFSPSPLAPPGHGDPAPFFLCTSLHPLSALEPPRPSHPINEPRSAT